MVKVEGMMVIVVVGVFYIEVIKIVRDYFLIGLEFVVGILGLIGGVIFMNVGVYGGEIKIVVDYVIVMECDG